jgi:hypothetical protein
MYQEYEKRVIKVFEDLKKDQKIIIKEISDDFEELSDDRVIKKVLRVENSFKVKVPEEFYSYIFSLDELKLNWNINFGDCFETGGEIYITNITGMFLNPLTTFDKNTVPPHEAKLLKQGYRFFDFRAASGDMAAVKVNNGQVESNVYWVLAAEEPIRLNLSYPEYMEHILKVRGLHFWQYLFSDLTFDEVDFNLEEELTERLPYLTMLFPAEDFSEYFERFERMKAQNEHRG